MATPESKREADINGNPKIKKMRENENKSKYKGVAHKVKVPPRKKKPETKKLNIKNGEKANQCKIDAQVTT